METTDIMLYRISCETKERKNEIREGLKRIRESSLIFYIFIKISISVTLVERDRPVKDHPTVSLTMKSGHGKSLSLNLYLNISWMN